MLECNELQGFPYIFRSVVALSATTLLACGSDIAGMQDSDASPIPDAGAQLPDAEPACTAEVSQTFYADFDGDSYGSPDLTAVDCSQPEGFVDNDLDCDDTDSRNNPEGVELCDGIDNDCDAATIESCPNGCSPQMRGNQIYLFCSQALTFTAAAAACSEQEMLLIRIDDQAEQDWMSAQRVIVFSGRPRVWIGGSDATTERTWVWPDNDNFWQGNSGGAAVDGLFTRWRGGEPNNNDNGGEDCATADDTLSAQWDDRQCNSTYRFICERPAMVSDVP